MSRPARRYWLMKTEPDEFSIEDLARDGRTDWTGVRNYQARNLLRDELKPGDLVLVYHSSCDPLGVAGIGNVSGGARPDATAWDPASPYHDPRSTPEQPRWWSVEVEFVERFAQVVTLDRMRGEPALEGLLALRRGYRLSVQPVSEEHFRILRRMGGAGKGA